MKKTATRHKGRLGPQSNIILLSFEKAVEGLLSVKPKRKPAKRKKTNK